MCDTIKIARPIPKMPRSEELKARGWRKHFNQITGKQTGWFYKEKEGSRFPYLYIFTAPDGITYLSVRVSLPAFFFGSNVQMLRQTEIYQALIKLTDYATDKSGVEFDASTATVWEIHFTKDYYVGEFAMQQIISRLSNMNIPGFKRGGYSDTTLYFHSKGRGKEENKPRTICIYDKHADCLEKSFSRMDTEKAAGMLRLEFRYKTTDAVKRLVKNLRLPGRDAKTLLDEKISAALLNPVEKQILSVLEEMSAQDRLLALTKAYGKRRTASLVQFLFYQETFGNDFYKIKALDYTRSAYYECQKQCRAIGIITLTDKPKTEMQVAKIP